MGSPRSWADGNGSHTSAPPNRNSWSHCHCQALQCHSPQLLSHRYCTRRQRAASFNTACERLLAKSPGDWFLEDPTMQFWSGPGPGSLWAVIGIFSLASPATSFHRAGTARPQALHVSAAKSDCVRCTAHTETQR